MITMILSLILSLIFLILAGFHYYWLFGGDWGLSHVIPSKTKEAKTLDIPKFATLIVALGLTAVALLYLLKSGMMNFQLPDLILNYGYWIIPSIFTLRAIGEFKYVGFFKKIKDTKFAEADSKIFVPLCFFIGLVGILVQVI